MDSYTDAGPTEDQVINWAEHNAHIDGAEPDDRDGDETLPYRFTDHAGDEIEIRRHPEGGRAVVDINDGDTAHIPADEVPRAARALYAAVGRADLQTAVEQLHAAILGAGTRWDGAWNEEVVTELVQQFFDAQGFDLQR